MEQAPVVVIGSVMVDRVLYGPALPTRGSTVIGERMEQHLGGKGLNQAMQVHLLGGEVTFIGAVGKDPDGHWVLDALHRLEFPHSHLKMLPHPTGAALICVDAVGDNQIGVAPGANMALGSHACLEALAGLREGGYLVASLEVPLDTLEQAFERAREQGRKIIVNAAPWRALPESWWTLVDGWIFNEVEADGCFGAGFDLSPYTGHPLFEHAEWVIVTKGDAGAEIYSREFTICLPAHPIDAVDSVGAGDSFVGALVYRLAQGAGVKQAAGFANAAAALCCTYRGAIPSLPTRAQVKAFQQAATQ